jgi:hypothetical protein
MLRHKHVLRVFFALALLGSTACATTQSRVTPRSEFEDIPVPRGLSFVEDRSTIIESPSVKAARMLYRGRIEPVSLAGAMRTTLESNGWRSVSHMTSSPIGTTQVYEKAGNSLQIRVWEEWWYTYIELTASRALVGGGTSSAARQPQ